jgi:hypothetical protein
MRLPFFRLLILTNIRGPSVIKQQIRPYALHKNFDYSIYAINAPCRWCHTHGEIISLGNSPCDHGGNHNPDNSRRGRDDSHTLDNSRHDRDGTHNLDNNRRDHDESHILDNNRHDHDESHILDSNRHVGVNVLAARPVFP